MTTSDEENNRAATAATGMGSLEDLLAMLGGGPAPFEPKAECKVSVANKKAKKTQIKTCEYWSVSTDHSWFGYRTYMSGIRDPGCYLILPFWPGKLFKVENSKSVMSRISGYSGGY
jgi:hypothetical protein